MFRQEWALVPVDLVSALRISWLPHHWWEVASGVSCIRRCLVLLLLHVGISPKSSPDRVISTPSLFRIFLPPSQPRIRDCHAGSLPRPNPRPKWSRISQTILLHLLWRKNGERLCWPFSSLASRLYLRITQKRLHVKFLYEGMTITTSTPHSRLDS